MMHFFNQRKKFDYLKTKLELRSSGIRVFTESGQIAFRRVARLHLDYVSAKKRTQDLNPAVNFY